MLFAHSLVTGSMGGRMLSELHNTTVIVKSCLPIYVFCICCDLFIRISTNQLY